MLDVDTRATVRNVKGFHSFSFSTRLPRSHRASLRVCTDTVVRTPVSMRISVSAEEALELQVRRCQLRQLSWCVSDSWRHQRGWEG